MTHTIDLTPEDISAVREACAWLEENAPAGLPMTDNIRAGRMLLARLAAFREKFPGTELSPAVTARRGAKPAAGLADVAADPVDAKESA